MPTPETIEEITTQILNPEILNQEKNVTTLSLMLLQLSLKIRNIKVEPINSTLKNNIMFYCNELPFLNKTS